MSKTPIRSPFRVEAVCPASTAVGFLCGVARNTGDAA
ncbi:hypothetical protein C7441_116108 [Pseudaminobacter salicylatoxidans]|uniref:Uncharacterized protein n=1 Tax=Pseudaminobacter salicylatoxidans TaxID=93369 RepID=A0A316BW00_PSESE|nr:hypothetical protein C7441_116108 [Pseudaminobacter salicylatoxidans]